MQSIKFLLILFSCFFTISCNLPDSKIEGEIFLSEKDGTINKPILVPVRLHQKKKFDELARQRKWEEIDALPPKEEQLTNNEGKFSFNVPKGEYLIVAAIPKNKPLKNETIYWNIPVYLSKDKVTVVLTNQNITYKTGSYLESDAKIVESQKDSSFY